MGDQEVSLNAWILVGNALHNALHGPATLQIAESLQRTRLQELDAMLRSVTAERMAEALAGLPWTDRASVTAERMAEALAGLPWTDRALLLSLCDAMLERTGTSAATLLGMERSEAGPVLDVLRGQR